MKENRNIPDPEKSWSSAEKMLDDHFRRKRIIFWSMALLITAVITGLTLFILNTDKTTEKFVASSQESIAPVSENLDAQTGTPKNLSSSSNATSSNNNLQASVSNVLPNSDNKINSNKVGQNEKYSIEKPVKSKPTSAAALSLSNNNSLQSPFTTPMSTLTGTPAFDSNIETQNKPDQKIKYASPLYASLKYSVKDFSAQEKSWPLTTGKKFCSPIGWEATFYGGAQYVQKTLSTTNDWDNYIQHRKNEEDPIVTPAIGLSVTANKNSWGLSMGFEYTYYGEETNYYPYSNQQTITTNSSWQTYITNYVDTDTAYVTGNQFFLQTAMQRQDSSYVTDHDTIEEYKYDQYIAENNGINRIYYVEMPIEVSYRLTRGKAGFGISAGIAPALLTQTKGHYLRADGKGIESFDEIESFRKFMVNGRFSVDFYYRAGARTKLVLRPQFRTNLNSVFEDSYGVKQKYYTTGVLFGVSYMLN